VLPIIIALADRLAVTPLVALVIEIAVVLIDKLAPTLTNVALAVVVFIPPLRLAKPEVVMELLKVIPAEVITELTVLLPTKNAVVLAIKSAPTFSATEALAVVVLIPPLSAVRPVTVKVFANETVLRTARLPSVSMLEELITVLTVLLPTLNAAVLILTLAPTLTAVVELAVVVFIPPLRVVKPVVVSVFDKTVAPEIVAVLVTDRLDEIVSVSEVATLPPLISVVANKVLAPNLPITVPLPVELLPVAVPSTVTA